MVSAIDENKKRVIRAYTPIKEAHTKPTTITLAIRVYRPNEHPKFPEGGKMSQTLDSLKISDTIRVKGPIGHIIYKQPSVFLIDHKHKIQCHHAVFLCGGTGLTPAFRIATEIINNPNDDTKVYILYGARAVEDLLMKKEMDEMALKFKDQFHVHYTVASISDEEAKTWPFDVGYITEDMATKFLPNGLDGNKPIGFAGVCGPPPMIEFCAIPILSKLGYSGNHLCTF